MELHNLEFTKGSKKDHFRKGRGIGSGNGKTSGSGHKGQNSRSGGGVRLGFEGGQNPLYRRIPKRGFKHFGRIEYVTINLDILNRFEDNTIITAALLIETGLIPGNTKLLKVLGDGELTKPLKVVANKFSKTAIEKIEKAKGTIEVL